MITMNDKLKVLWFSNLAFSDIKHNGSGTWLHSMAEALVNTGAIQLFNITQARVKDATRQNSKSICQWLVPYESLSTYGLPSSKTIQEIQNIVDDIKPDIIHIWGTECYWGLLTSRGYIKGNIILEIQGLKFAIEKYFYSGLSFLDILKCFGLKEILKPSVSLIGLKYFLKQWGKFEKEILMNHKYISTQSDWVRVHIKNVNPMAQIFNTSIPLRTEFIVANKWEVDSCLPYQVFTSTSSIMPYKGLHILLDAIAILNKRYPQIRLHIAGSNITGLREGGYSKWLKKKIKRLGIDPNVIWTGALDAKSLIMQIHKANVVVVPSFVESYCLAFDEALTVGAPTVASFAGAMPELATHEKTALFFSPGDVVMCANAIERFFVDSDYAAKVSCNAYNEKKTKNNTNIALSQLTTYRKIMSVRLLT